MKPNTEYSEFGGDFMWWSNEMGTKVYLFRHRDVCPSYFLLPKTKILAKNTGTTL